MPNRRQVLLCATAGVAAGLLPRIVSAGSADVANDGELWTVVYDSRFGECHRFAAAVASNGLPTTAINGDVTELWYDHLYHKWQQQPAAIAGLTTKDTFFCLQTLGIDAGLRVAYQATHRVAQGHVNHLQLAGQARYSIHRIDSGPTRDWPTRVAQLVTLSSPSRKRFDVWRAARRISSDDALETPLLVSWVLAPRHPRPSKA
jgi:hypothetical protein